jgi:hypothetical protein
VPRQDLSQHYETLRAAALGEPTQAEFPQGLALLLCRGLPAWMHAWSQCVSATPPPVPQPGRPPTILPAGVAGQVALVLASMILQRQEHPA